MKQIVCEMCGSNDLLKQDGVFVCQSCGTKYSVEEAKKLMIEGVVEVEGSVKIDDTEKIENLYKLARRAKENGDAEDAIKYYGMILESNSVCWESAFYEIYFKTMNSTLANMDSSAELYNNSLKNIMMIVRDNVENSNKQDVIEEIIDQTTVLANMMYDAAVDTYENTDSSIRYQFNDAFRERCLAAREMCFMCGKTIVEVFESEENKKMASKALDAAIKMNRKFNSISHYMISGLYLSDLVETEKKYLNFILKYDVECYKKYKLEQIESYEACIEMHQGNIEKPENDAVIMKGGIIFIVVAGVLFFINSIGESTAILTMMIIFLVIGIFMIVTGSGSSKKTEQNIVKNYTEKIAEIRKEIDAL